MTDRKFYLIVLILALAIMGGFYLFSGPPVYLKDDGELLKRMSPSTETESPKPTPKISAATIQPTPIMSESHILSVPFTPQAPTANWDQLHEAACEEASAIMANAYFTGDRRTKIPAGEVEASLTILTDWQQKTFGYYLDTTAEETAQMMESVFGLNADVISNFTIQDVRSAILANKLVIIPVNGREIGNPNYKSPGPLYHMLLIRGFNETQFITNDSGTRKGELYPYKFETIMNAAGNWSHSVNTVDLSRPVMIVVSK